MRVLAFDPGFERLGAAIVEKIKGKEMLVHSSCARTSASLPFHERLYLLAQAAEARIKKYRPDAMALEEIYFAKNEKTAIKVAEVRGMLIYLATLHKLKLYEYTPLQVKVATTGYGKSDKRAVKMMVFKLLGITALPEGRKSLDDEIDAIAIGLTCLASVR